MKVLVTGGAGFCGSHVVDGLIDAGHEVVIVDDLSSGREENLNPRAKFYRLDIRSPALEEVFKAERPSCVNHHAAQISVRASMQDPLRDASLNILGTINLLECCKRHGVEKLVYISTGGAVYGEPLYLPCDEEHPVRPLCQYGASKHTVEHYLHLYHQLHGLRYTVLRYPNIYGPRQDPHGEAGVVAIFARQMLNGEQAVINGSGEQERDFLYVGDAVTANLLALEKGGDGIYNLGWGKGVSVNQLFQTMVSLTGYRRLPLHGPPIPGEVFKIYLDARKAEKELGWRPQVALEEGLRLTVDFFRRQARG
jgi:UDP-glucose 4-epimerase